MRNLEDTADPVKDPKQSSYKLPRDLKVGDSVLIFDIDKKAEVLELPDKGQVLVQAGIIKTRTPLKNLRLIEKSKVTVSGKPYQTGQRRSRIDTRPVTEVDVRGYTADEAVMEVDKVLDTAVIYPVKPREDIERSKQTVLRLIKKHNVDIISIGNGTASRETEAMTVEMLHSFPEASYAIVNEAGASVYSASPLAAEEFPEYDVNLRSAVSIARRLQDPLAELVKIDPKAIGVGQYQHDCPQKELDSALGGVVEDCVNAVGVDANTASRSLLQQVSGLNATTAKNIVAYREENGPFTSRAQLKKVPKLGPKAFEQCAGFLRIPESKEMMDNTGVHPESYAAAKALIGLFGLKKGDDLSTLPQKLESYGAEKAAAECAVGEHTLVDIAKELAKPGRDPRDELPAPVLRKDVLEMKDLKPGMELTGTVRNVIDFGVFVDIGVHQDGLVHISEVCNRRLRHPSEVVKVGDIVKVVMLGVDEKRHRISLSMKQAK